MVGAEVEAVVEMVDSVKHLYVLSQKGLTYDLVVLDPPYATSAQRGGNRQLTDFSLISPEEFREIVTQAEKLLSNDDSQICMMISGGESGKKDVERYLRVFDSCGLHVSKRGRYTKYNSNGTVCNMGQFTMPAEQIIFYSRSGREREDIVKEDTADYHFERPPLAHNGGYSTQKPLGMMEAIIQRTTRVGEKVLDVFGGSGVTLQASLRLQRRVHILEISKKAVENFILPRLRLFGASKDSVISVVPKGAMVQGSLF